MLINLGLRLANYLAAPYIERASNWAVEIIASIPSETKRRWAIRLAYTLRPLFIFVDYFRLALVRGYVHNSKCFRVLAANIHELNSLLFIDEHREKPPKPVWTRRDASEKKTTLVLFPVLLLTSPLFFLSDFIRSGLIDYLYPTTHSQAQTLLNIIWAVQYGSVIST